MIDKLGHTAQVLPEVLPTCESTGLTEGSKCSVCNTVLQAQEEVSALGHNMVIDGAVAPTCTETGLTEGSHCSRCSNATTPQQVVPAKGHNYSSVVTAPDCENGGYTTYTCSVCGDSYVSDEENALGHSYNAVVTAPDCENGGYTTYTCSVCGDSYVSDEENALGHSYNAVVTAPDCENGGYTTYTCSVCGDTYKSNEVAALGHSYKAVVTEPTCTTGGYTTYTCSCGHSYVDNIVSANGHNNVAIVTAPTCTADGYTTYTCKTCGETKTGELVKATGHNEVIDEAVAPTCTSTGLTEGSHCSTCNEVLVAQTVVGTLDHNYNAVVTAPTCTASGYTTYTCSCGASYVGDEVAKLGHKIVVDEAVEATCTTSGLTAGEHCENCDYKVAQQAIPAGHKSVNDVAKNPTCTETGLTAGSHCSVCGEVLVAQEIIPANGHLMGDWSYSTKPTFSATGKETRKCQNSGCTYSETQTAAKLTKVYLKPNSNWTSDGARFAAYFFNNSTGKNYWVSMTDNDGDGVYEATIPSGTWPNVIFCRMNPGNSTNNWNNKWTQTGDLSLSSSNNLYTLNDGSWDAGKWSTFRALDPITGTLFFTPTAAWKSSCAGGFAAYFFGNGDKWVTMTDADGDGTYECVAPEGFYHVIFVGLKNTTANWDNKAEQTENLRPENGNNHYTLSSKSWSHKHAVKSFDAVAATCEADGYNAYVECTCAYCFYSSKIVINQLGHDMVDATCENPSTCEREGCTHTEGEALGHTGGTAACGARLVCDRCANEYGDPVAHNEVEHEGQAATCTENGWNAYVTCSNCDYTTYSEIKATGHTLTGAVGSWQYCVCGLAKKETTTTTWEKVTDVSTLKSGDKVVIVASGYNYALGGDNGNNRLAISVTKTGNTITWSGGVQVLTLGGSAGAYTFHTGSGYLYAASTSSNHLKEQTTLSNNGKWTITISNGVATIKSVGNTSRGWLRFNDSNSPKIFSCYGSGQADVSIYVQKTTSTNEEHNCFDKERVLDAVAPSCSATGLTAGSECSVCGRVIVAQETVEKLDHNLVDATCEAPKHCTGCDLTEGGVAEHNYVDGICKWCGESEHTCVYNAVVTAPTCTENGYTTYTCSTCDNSYEDDVVDALGHSWVDATCQAAKHCDRAGCTATEGSKVDHIYESGKCKWCDEVEVKTPTYKKVTSASEITSGTYVLIVNGYVMTKYDSTGWVLVEKYTVSGDTIVSDTISTWTLTVNGSNVSLKDANGTFIKPKSGNNNGIQTGSYNWAFTFSNGTVNFKGTGSDTTILASNTSSQNKIRAYKTSTVSGSSSSYPSNFTLYKLVE